MTSVDWSDLNIGVSILRSHRPLQAHARRKKTEKKKIGNRCRYPRLLSLSVLNKEKYVHCTERKSGDKEWRH